MARLYVARDDRALVISRSRLRRPGARRLRHPWPALVDVVARPGDRIGWATAAVPPLATALITTASVSIEAGVAAGAVVFFGISYLAPRLHRLGGTGAGRPSLLRRFRPVEDAITLTAPAERAAFDDAVGVADRISETWPQLGSLVDRVEAEALLAGALWEIATHLARREELSAVLAGLSRPEFAAPSPADPTARELHAQLRATRAALADLDAQLATRQASLARAERAGRDFIRDQDMRSAIRAAEQSLRTTHRPASLATPEPDPGADLAEQTRSVLDAYRELTAGVHPHGPG